MELTGAPDITLRGLTLHMPVVPMSTGGTTLHLSVGLLASAAPRLTVEDCTFQATVPTFALIGMGLVISGESVGLTARRNSFVGGNFAAGSSVFGVVASASNAMVTTALDRADISDNVFEQLGAGVVTFSQLGLLRCANNRVIGCRTGLYFAASNLGAAGQAAQQGLAAGTQTGQSGAISVALNSGMQAPLLAAAAGNVAHITAKSSQPPSPPPVSEAAHRVLVEDITARGTQAWDALAASASAPPAGEAADAASAASERAANAAGRGASGFTKELSDQIVESLGTVQEIALAAELAAKEMTPVLHISGNDVTLVSTEAAAMPGIGIAVVLSPNDQTGTVVMAANRVLTADVRTIAAATLFPAAAAVTGNTFMQPAANAGNPAPAFLSFAQASAKVEVMANVIVTASLILPARAGPPPSATSWNFLNTVG
jgi:hypothetical protein